MFSPFVFVFPPGISHKLHIKTSKYDSTSGTQICVYLKKVEGMRLWNGTGTNDNDVADVLKKIQNIQENDRFCTKD